MKELSIEEKAKRYDEALERAKKYKLKEDLIITQDLFPELKESEDERIRKNCIHFLELQKTHHASTFEIDECIAWLEKEGEKNPVPGWMPKFLDELRSVKNCFDWDEHKDIEGHILAIIQWMNPNYFNGEVGLYRIG